MIDYFAIAVSHGLLALAAWRLLLRGDLDSDDGDGSTKRHKPWLRTQNATQGDAGDA